MKNIFFSFLFALLVCPLFAAEPSALASAVEKGLFEEEVNRDFPAAIAAYEAALAHFDQDRELAATALFRLAENYRRAGRTEEAAALYERVVREFYDYADFAGQAASHLGAKSPRDADASSQAAEGAAPSEEVTRFRQMEFEHAAIALRFLEQDQANAAYFSLGGLRDYLSQLTRAESFNPELQRLFLHPHIAQALSALTAGDHKSAQALLEVFMKGAQTAAAAAPVSSEFSPVTIRIQTEDGRPLAGFRVEMESTEGRRVVATGESNASGLALSRNMPYGDYRLTITEPSGWGTSFDKLTVEVDAPFNQVVNAPNPEERGEVRIRSAIDLRAFQGLKFGGVRGMKLPSEFGEAARSFQSFPELGNGIEKVAFEIRCSVVRSVVQPDGSRKMWRGSLETSHFLLNSDRHWIVSGRRSGAASVIDKGRFFALGDSYPRPAVFLSTLTQELVTDPEISLEVPAGDFRVAIDRIVGNPDAELFAALGFEKTNEVWLQASFYWQSESFGRILRREDWDQWSEQFGQAMKKVVIGPNETKEVVFRSPDGD